MYELLEMKYAFKVCNEVGISGKMTALHLGPVAIKPLRILEFTFEVESNDGFKNQCTGRFKASSNEETCPPFLCPCMNEHHK